MLYSQCLLVCTAALKPSSILAKYKSLKFESKIENNKKYNHYLDYDICQLEQKLANISSNQNQRDQTESTNDNTWA